MFFSASLRLCSLCASAFLKPFYQSFVTIIVQRFISDKSYDKISNSKMGKPYNGKLLSSTSCIRKISPSGS
jgi:hypothetical protein